MSLKRIIILTFSTIIIIISSLYVYSENSAQLEATHIFQSEGGTQVKLTASASKEPLRNNEISKMWILMNLTSLNPEASDIHDIQISVIIQNDTKMVEENQSFHQ